MNNIIKIYLLRGLLLFCTGIGLLAVGCSNDNDDSSRELASKTNLTLTEYYNEQGTITVPAWERNDKAGLFVTTQNAPEAVYAQGEGTPPTPEKPSSWPSRAVPE